MKLKHGAIELPALPPEGKCSTLRNWRKSITDFMILFQAKGFGGLLKCSSDIPDEEAECIPNPQSYLQQEYRPLSRWSDYDWQWLKVGSVQLGCLYPESDRICHNSVSKNILDDIIHLLHMTIYSTPFNRLQPRVASASCSECPSKLQTFLLRQIL